jgi:hypothetical protein
MSGEVREVWGAYHERERLCPEGVRVVEIAHVHYACESHAALGGKSTKPTGVRRACSWKKYHFFPKYASFLPELGIPHITS